MNVCVIMKQKQTFNDRAVRSSLSAAPATSRQCRQRCLCGRSNSLGDMICTRGECVTLADNTCACIHNRQSDRTKTKVIIK